MVFCLCVTALPAAAFAAEDGLVTSTDTTTGTVTDGEGNTVITVTVEKQTQGTTAEGVTVNREETRSDTTKVDPDGNVMSTSYVDEGSEKREWDEEVKPGDLISCQCAGAYTMGFNSCFINLPPYVYLKQGDRMQLVRDKNQDLLMQI